ncbi:afadin- and alpha-actinin-binding protein-like isoform X2 [Portunus trituberculatus]|nr:afadin- and alpha-actinin-binding protein-like isoform X2 [Portunus trituberculatus]
MGLGCPLIETEGQRVNLVALVNACWEVTQLYRASVRDTSTLQEQHRRNAADINHFQTSIKDLRGEVIEKERLVGEAQEKERRATIGSKSLAAKLKTEKEEVRRLSSVMQQREAQHQHELKKKEMENDHLKDRLHRLISAEIRQPAVTLSAKITRGNRSRAKWKTEASSARHEEELYKQVLGHYEAWIAQVNDENDQLKSSLLRISSQMAKIGEKYCKVDTQELPDGDMNISMTSSTFSTDSLDNFVTNQEFSACKDRLQEIFDKNMKALVQFLEEAQKTDNNNENQLKEDKEDLKRQLIATNEEMTTYKSAVGKYDPEKAGEVDSSFLLEGRNIEEEAYLEKERQNLMKEREILEKEKRIFTEATIRLNRERASFEAEKAELLKEQFLQDLPATLEADLIAESGGSLSSGSIGEIFDSPQYMVAVPNITSPSRNITYIEGPPVVLGPSRLSKQQQDSSRGLSNRMSYGFKSAPASRASSSSRQSEDKRHTLHGVTGTRPPSGTRPRTLERTRRKSCSITRTPLSKNKSQSQGNLVKDSNKTGEKEEETSYNSSYFLNSTKINLQHHKDYLDFDRVYSDSQTYQREMSPYSRKYSGSPPAAQKDIRPNVQSQENLYETNSVIYKTDNSSSIDALEADLAELLEQQIGPKHETASGPGPDVSFSRVTLPKSKPRPKVFSLLRTTPINLFSSRRSSQDFSCTENGEKKMQKPSKKAGY